MRLNRCSGNKDDMSETDAKRKRLFRSGRKVRAEVCQLSLAVCWLSTFAQKNGTTSVLDVLDTEIILVCPSQGPEEITNMNGMSWYILVYLGISWYILVCYYI